MNTSNISREYVLTLLAYDTATGVFTWRNSRGRAKAGMRAGNTCSQGYRRIKIDGRFYAEHRLVWLVEHGNLPTGEVDHKDRVRDNNRISNLRVVSRKLNMENTGRHGRNTSGFKGVSFCKVSQKWRAFICHKRRVMSLGYFLTPEDAHAAYVTAREKFFQEVL